MTVTTVGRNATELSRGFSGANAKGLRERDGHVEIGGPERAHPHRERRKLALPPGALARRRQLQRALALHVHHVTPVAVGVLVKVGLDHEQDGRRVRDERLRLDLRLRRPLPLPRRFCDRGRGRPRLGCGPGLRFALLRVDGQAPPALLVAAAPALAALGALRRLRLVLERYEAIEALATLAPLQVLPRGPVQPHARVADAADVLVLLRDEHVLAAAHEALGALLVAHAVEVDDIVEARRDVARLDVSQHVREAQDGHAHAARPRRHGPAIDVTVHHLSGAIVPARAPLPRPRSISSFVSPRRGG